MIELTTLLDQARSYSVANKYSTYRQVSRREPFGNRHQVSLDVKIVAAEPFTGSAKPTNHFIGDDEHVIPGANFLDARPVG